MKENNNPILALRLITLCIFCGLLPCVCTPFAAAQSVVTVISNGDPANRVDLAILGDGYTSVEMGKFADDVQQVLNGIFAQQPFAEYRRYFNVHRVDVVSSESGVDHPELNPPVSRNTAFDAGYNCSGIQRLVCVNASKVQTVASAKLPPALRDILLVIVNDPQYGGSGGSIAVASTNSAVVELVLHEEGHSFGLLGDEYGGPPPPACTISSESPEANITIQTQRSLIKWRQWIDALTPLPTLSFSLGVPGLYEGAQYCDAGKYRPTFMSKMRALSHPFEQINSEQLIKRIYNWVSPLDSSGPVESQITLSRGRTQLYSISTPRPFTHDLTISWSVDGALAGNSAEFTLDSGGLTVGAHTVEVNVEDNTDMVRNDPGKILTERRTWQVNVTDASGVDIRLAAGGAATASTAGTGSIRSGYAEVSVGQGSTPYGTAVFGFIQNGVVVSEAGVPASPPTTSARIFVDYRAAVNSVPARNGAGTVDINTGIAVVNYGSQTAHVTYTLRDLNGNTIAVGHGSIDAKHHLACFIDQLRNNGVSDFNLPANFRNSIRFGSLDISGDQQLSVLALRGTTNQRDEFLITTTPVADLRQAPGRDPIYFPQFVDGGGYTTSIILLNTSDVRETGVLEIRDRYGNPLTVNQAGGERNWTFGYSIEPGGFFHFQTDGAPDSTAAGWVRLVPTNGTATPAGSGIFGFNPKDVLESESGIPSASPTTHARVYIDLSGKHNTGLAIANVSGVDSSIIIKAFQMDGVTGDGTGREPIPLPPYGYTAAFAGSFVTGLPEGFTGVLSISSTLPFAALTLRSLTNERGEFLMTTFPIADGDKTAVSPVFFPHIVDGGGYTTQFILISSGGDVSTNLRIYDESGLALDIAH